MNLMDWLSARTGRERILLGVLVGVLVPLGLVFGLLLPLAEQREAAERALANEEKLNVWVAARAAEAAKLAPAEPEAAKDIPEPIGISALEQGLKKARLWPYVKRLEAQAQGGIALDFEEVVFTELMNWLERSHPRWGYEFDSFRMEPRAQSAMVKVSMVLVDAE